MSAHKKASGEKPDAEPGSDYKVGPGNPPLEHRWPRGFCPNPAGRPRKKVVEMKLPLPPTAFELEVLKFARETVIDDNGRPVSNLNLVFRTMKAMMMQKPELGKILLDRIDAAAKAEEEHKLSMLQDAIAFKADMGPRFAKARALGKPLPPVYPDPDDIIIRDDGSVTFIGPVNADEARQLKVLLDHRDLLFKSAQDTVADAGDKYSVELAREYWGIFRREYYKFSKFIPKRYRKTFPPFKPREANEGTKEEG